MSTSSANGAVNVRRMLSKAGALVRGRIGAIQWLVICGAALVLAIALGTAYLALQYRERAIKVAERDLTNTALLLSRHFDQQLSDLQHVHEDIITYVRAGGAGSTGSTRTRTTPALIMPSALAALVDTSMIRPRMNGPRSLTRHSIATLP